MEHSKEGEEELENTWQNGKGLRGQSVLCQKIKAGLFPYLLEEVNSCLFPLPRLSECIFKLLHFNLTQRLV